MFRMPTCDLSQFTEDEQEIIRPLLDQKNQLKTHKPILLTDEQEYLFIQIMLELLTNKYPENSLLKFRVPYQSVNDKYFNPFAFQTVEQVRPSLTFKLMNLLRLSNKFISHSIIKVYDE